MTTITIQFANGNTKTLSARALLWRATLPLAAMLMLVTFPFRRIFETQNAAVLRPTMEHIADRGGTAADMWLISHYHELWRLPAAAAADNPRAMYLQGQMLIYQGHRNAGKRLIQRSAAAGFSCAVMQQDLHRKNSFFSRCW